MNNEERKEYFKEYYLRTKEIKKKNHDKPDKVKTRGVRGRPRKIIPPYKKTYLEEPIIMYW